MPCLTFDHSVRSAQLRNDITQRLLRQTDGRTDRQTRPSQQTFWSITCLRDSACGLMPTAGSTYRSAAWDQKVRFTLMYKTGNIAIYSCKTHRYDFENLENNARSLHIFTLWPSLELEAASRVNNFWNVYVNKIFQYKVKLHKPLYYVRSKPPFVLHSTDASRVKCFQNVQGQ